MGNIFLYRHGDDLNPDSDDEKLSWQGFNDAQSAGKAIAEIINDRWMLFRKKKISHEEFGGLLKVHSGTLRTKEFLENMVEAVEKNFSSAPLNFYGDSIDVSSSDIYRKGKEKILEISEFCYPLAKTQFIVGHNPGIVKSVNYYLTEKGFDFNGDENLLKATPKGKGYWINTIDKSIKTID